MSPVTDLHRTITDLDHVRIFNLLRRQTAAGGAPEHVAELAEIIDVADQVRPQEVAADVVTMLSRLRVADPATGAERSITLCYPPEADAAQGMISVLSPLGTSLLGLRVGEVAHWHGVDGKPGALSVQAIEFQPEASGDYTA